MIGGTRAVGAGAAVSGEWSDFWCMGVTGDDSPSTPSILL